MDDVRTAVASPEDGDYLVFETTEPVGDRDSKRIREELAIVFDWPLNKVVLLQNLHLTVVRVQHD